MKGYNGSILRADLSAGAFRIEHPPEPFYETYLGGRGFIVHTLLKEVPKGADPLGPENKLIFAVGPLTGYLPGGGRNSVGAKSPLTNGYGESEAGGFFGAELKRAGFDAIILEGESKTPVYLWINRGSVEIRDAGCLWGMEIARAAAALQTELGEKSLRTALIGPGGENRLRYASIANDIRHIYGRMGMGAVMGAKRLKAIAVRGEKFPKVHQKERLTELSRWMGKNYKAAPFWECGTGIAMEKYAENGNLPVRNFTGKGFPEVKKITARAMCQREFLVDMHSCFMCPMRCKKMVEAHGRWPVDPVYGGPEYETLAAFGSNCGIDSLEAVMKAHELCNRYGIDTISTGASIAFAMECFEKGLLTAKDTDGLDLRFGNAAAMLETVEKIVRREGIGALLSEGTRRAAERIGRGAEALAMHVKGEELPMHDPRHNRGMGLQFSVHATGADHCTGMFDDVDLARPARWVPADASPLPPSSPGDLDAGKAHLLHRIGFYRQACNQLGLCQFLPWTVPQVIEALEAITGWPVTYECLFRGVERSMTLMRVFNIREGFRKEHDTLPTRFMSCSEEIPQREAIPVSKMREAQHAYYQYMGWDEQGIPKEDRLRTLGIEWADEYLQEGRNPGLCVDSGPGQGHDGRL